MNNGDVEQDTRDTWVGERYEKLKVPGESLINGQEVVCWIKRWEKKSENHKKSFFFLVKEEGDLFRWRDNSLKIEIKGKVESSKGIDFFL